MEAVVWCLQSVARASLDNCDSPESSVSGVLDAWRKHKSKHDRDAGNGDTKAFLWCT